MVVEILLGLAIGPALLGWVQPDGLTSVLSTLGVAMLFFLSGYEIDFVRIGGAALTRAGLGWLISLVAGVVVGLVLATFLPANGPSTMTTGLFIGICLTSTALGTIMPTLRDAGETTTPFGRAVIAAGAAGQFGPLLALAIFFGWTSPALLIPGPTGFWWGYHPGCVDRVSRCSTEAPQAGGGHATHQWTVCCAAAVTGVDCHDSRQYCPRS